ncbi:MAG TPA: hypothetical protein VD993_19485 [Chitinophagaceae bacterium]|nr:hypothetical protein [Chitinophagaceae bacterium]
MIVLLLALLPARGQQSPKLQEIVERFYSNYEIPFDNYQRAVFAKKLNKWYVSTANWVDSRLVIDKTYLFYDEGYRKLPLNPQYGTDSVEFSRYFDEWLVYHYGLHPYYGYEGWYKDVINFYRAKNKLTDDELYSLARAYSGYAISLLVDQQQDAIKAEMYQCHFTTNCLNEEQIRKYRQIEGEAIKAYKLLASRNPKYETRVGSIAVKHANEYMVEFHSLLTFAENHSRTMQLPDNIYPDSLIQKSTEYLNDCPQDAILVTSGDNDFYPLLYLQHKKKLRTDVHVVNYNLLGLDAFVYRATQPQFQAKGIQLSFDTVHYRKTTNDIVILEDSTGSMDLQRALDSIKYGKADERWNLKVLHAKEFVLGTQKGPLRLQFKKPYLFKTDVILLDAVQQLGNRKLCFTYDQDIDGFGDHLTQKGSVWIFND